MAGYVSEAFPAEAVEALESMEVFINPADKGFPSETAFELYVGDVDEKPNPELQFRFDVVISEPGIIDGKSLVQTINNFSAHVGNTVSALTPRLK